MRTAPSRRQPQSTREHFSIYASCCASNDSGGARSGRSGIYPPEDPRIGIPG
jgi:hypothetical protein